MHSIRAIVLDFDGVIIESNDIKTAAFERLFDRFPQHKEQMLVFHHSNISSSRFAKFRHLVYDVLNRPGDEVLVDELAREFSHLTVDQLCRCPFVKGAVEFLQEFTKRVPLFLASVTPDSDLLTVVKRRNLERFFKRVYGCPPWTKTAAIADVLERESLLPSEVVLVGDSPGDRVAAQTTGVWFIARDSGIALEPKPRFTFHDMCAVGNELKGRIAHEPR